MHEVSIIAEYRARGMEPEDESRLREEMAPLGPVRLRPRHLPEAGGSYEVDVLFQFIGTAFASGLIGHVGSKWYEKAMARLGRVVEQKVAKNQPPDLTATFSYDDIDIRVPMIASDELQFVAHCAEQVDDHLQSKALREHPPTAIVIGMSRDGDRWAEPNAANALEPDRRFWGIALETHRLMSHVYDTDTRLLSELPRAA